MGLSVKAQCRLKYLGRSTKMGGLGVCHGHKDGGLGVCHGNGEMPGEDAQYKSTKGVKEMGVQIVERQLW